MHSKTSLKLESVSLLAKKFNGVWCSYLWSRFVCNWLAISAILARSNDSTAKLIDVFWKWSFSCEGELNIECWIRPNSEFNSTKENNYSLYSHRSHIQCTRQRIHGSQPIDMRNGKWIGNCHRSAPPNPHYVYRVFVERHGYHGIEVQPAARPKWNKIQLYDCCYQLHACFELYKLTQQWIIVITSIHDLIWFSLFGNSLDSQCTAATMM